MKKILIHRDTVPPAIWKWITEKVCTEPKQPTELILIKGSRLHRELLDRIKYLS